MSQDIAALELLEMLGKSTRRQVALSQARSNRETAVSSSAPVWQFVAPATKADRPTRQTLLTLCS